MTIDTSHRRMPARYLAITAIAAIALVAGVSAPMLAHSSTSSLSATKRVQANPPPTLFTDQQIATIAGALSSQNKTATSLMRSWWMAHGTVRDDAGFISWVKTQIPAPPSAQQRAHELAAVQALDKTRTPAGIAAASWLERNGKKDIWTLYSHDQRELLDAPTGKAEKTQLKQVLKMAKTVADALGAKYRQSAPYVLDPSLRTDHTVKPGAVCPCSYPSRHAARSAGARTYLGFLAPRRNPDYRWMEQQVDYSRLYMAGHIQSDITAGSLLGDMIGQYYLITSGTAPIPH